MAKFTKVATEAADRVMVKEKEAIASGVKIGCDIIAFEVPFEPGEEFVECFEEVCTILESRGVKIWNLS